MAPVIRDVEDLCSRLTQTKILANPSQPIKKLGVVIRACD
jgi:hypothetical protein